MSTNKPFMNYPRVYVACLGCYNEGRLNGKWVDAEEYEDYAHKCKHPNHEEYAIHDYDFMPNLGEYPDVEKVVEVAEAVIEHGFSIVNDFIEMSYYFDYEAYGRDMSVNTFYVSDKGNVFWREC